MIPNKKWSRIYDPELLSTSKKWYYRIYDPELLLRVKNDTTEFMIPNLLLWVLGARVIREFSRMLIQLVGENFFECRSNFLLATFFSNVDPTFCWRGFFLMSIQLFVGETFCCDHEVGTFTGLGSRWRPVGVSMLTSGRVLSMFCMFLYERWVFVWFSMTFPGYMADLPYYRPLHQ